MRIREYTQDRLRFTDFPVGLAAVILCVMAVPAGMSFGYFRNGVVSGGLALAAIAGVLFIGGFAVFVRRTIITLDRTTGQVRVAEWGLFGPWRQMFPLEGISIATVQQKTIKDVRQVGERHRNLYDRKVYRPVLVYQFGPSKPLVNIYAGRNNADLVASAINGWIMGEPVPRKPLPKPSEQAADRRD